MIDPEYSPQLPSRSRLPPHSHPRPQSYNRPPSPPYGGRLQPASFDSTGKKNSVDLIHTNFLTFFLVVVNLDIVRTEEPDDTSDTEMTEMDLLLTPTVVFGFSLNDKIWCTFFF